ncbi:hypothetical protein GEAM_0012 [Ewingella americana ATCC 33852]|uniref:Uncharacterized protein n=1 Tax=Ewingella americana (strain ATCC 33852 / DSM 4580 / CCUG 14506 / JCM 5911 / LMG 7869 / NCTC 12157 / CDC 1468-78) TaxID=910964 RepID=A0A085GQA1_EWIA3|nr:hypothetical protein GEAM_0012 [Ewingella americana ATCC 33852]
MGRRLIKMLIRNWLWLIHQGSYLIFVGSLFVDLMMGGVLIQDVSF